MPQLERREFKNPPVRSAIFCLWHGLSLDGVRAVLPNFKAHFPAHQVQELRVQKFTLAKGSGKVEESVTGMMVSTEQGQTFSLDKDTIRLNFEGDYGDSEKHIQSLVDVSRALFPDGLPLVRASVRLTNFLQCGPDDLSGVFASFCPPALKELNINGIQMQTRWDATALLGHPGRCIMDLVSKDDGLELSIDVLDDLSGTFAEAFDRLKHVKSVETHIFLETLSSDFLDRYDT